jgi:hypothetical protein
VRNDRRRKEGMKQRRGEREEERGEERRKDIPNASAIHSGISCTLLMTCDAGHNVMVGVGWREKKVERRVP